MRRSDFQSQYDARFRYGAPGQEVSQPQTFVSSTRGVGAIGQRLQTVANGVLRRGELFHPDALHALLEELAVIAVLAEAETVNWPLLYLRVARLIQQATPFEERLPDVLDALRTLEVEIVSWAPRRALAGEEPEAQAEEDGEDYDFR
ncbi:MAG: hypothetical protein Q7P63_14525 [Verrucomicrobiota bacterium JB022]|nr:hypothetical protein [Verrucomicrobiota bacterium JB022]